MHMRESEFKAETITSKIIFAITSMCLLCVSFACAIAVVVCIREAIESWLSLSSSLYVLCVPFLVISACLSIWMVVLMVIEIVGRKAKK
jgi:hypothetical protein